MSIDYASLDLPAEATALTRWATNVGRKEFKQYGRVTPVILFIKDKNVGVMPIPTLAPAMKDKVAAIIANLRQDCEAVIFMFESWVSSYPLGTPLADTRLPRDDPNRTEAVMANLHVRGGVNLTFRADIKRNPTKLKDFRVMLDSRKGERMEGRFA
jgi:hypothetical protein